MRYTVVFSPVREEGFPSGYYYARIPALDLTTHGEGIDGAKRAAEELLRGWIEERRVHGETLSGEEDLLVSQLDIADAV